MYDSHWDPSNFYLINNKKNNVALLACKMFNSYNLFHVTEARKAQVFFAETQKI